MNLVTISNGQAVTNTLIIAKNTDVDHASIIKLVRTYQADLEEFGRVGFQIQPFETAGGMQQREIADLNEQQSTLILTYMRNSEIVRKFKKSLVKEFWVMAKRPAIDPANFSRLQLIEMAMQAEQERLVLAEQKAEVDAKLAVAAPKAEALDLISAGKDALTVTETAKVLSQKRIDLTTRMHAEGWVYRQNGSWVAYDKHIKNGNLAYKEAKYTDEKSGLECIKPYCHVTPKGLAKPALMFGIPANDIQARLTA